MIPARYSATRFPGKLMKDLGGKSVILRTYEADAGGKIIMSQKEHECGSDRIAEAVQDLDADIVINVQGDEPFIDTVSLTKLIAAFKNDITEEIDLASLKVEITDKKAIEDPNNVKVITDNHGFALYFSRSVIPFQREQGLPVKYFKHKGVYAFRKQALIDFYHLDVTPLEASEKIEAIRYLEVGKKIKMIETDIEAVGIDTPEDLERAKRYLNQS